MVEMNQLFRKILLAALLMPWASAANSTEAKIPGQIHEYPAAETQFSKPHELRFELPNDQIARAEFRSEEFYAIILKSADRCSLQESDRLEVQQLFPHNKVFMERFGCDNDIEESITYTNVNPDYAFIAVFAGTDIETAKQLLGDMDLKKEFPGANIRKMQAVLVYP